MSAQDQPIPADLAGFQNVSIGVVQDGDLLIPHLSAGPVDWKWAHKYIGSPIYDNGTCAAGEFRVYRKMPVAHQCDAHDEESVATVTPLPPTKARTDDDGKPPLAYLPWAGLEAVAMVQLYGQQKYGSFWNYKNGLEVGRNLSCAIRHIVAYMNGEDNDTESQQCHIAHATCRLLFVLQNLKDGKAIDDRYKEAK